MLATGNVRAAIIGSPSLAYKHSEIGNNDLALQHYLRIPYGERHQTTWNNLGVSFDRFDMPGKSVSAYRKAAEAGETLITAYNDRWGYLQTIYGLIRALDGGAALAWLAQYAATFAMGIIVWLVWRSSVRTSLLLGCCCCFQPRPREYFEALRRTVASFCLLCIS